MCTLFNSECTISARNTIRIGPERAFRDNRHVTYSLWCRGHRGRIHSAAVGALYLPKIETRRRMQTGSGESSMHVSTYHTRVTISSHYIQTGRPPVLASSELKIKNNLLIRPLFIQPTFEGIHRINLYHIIRQTIPNINDPVSNEKNISSHYHIGNVLSQFKCTASSTTNRIKI